MGKVRKEEDFAIANLLKLSGYHQLSDGLEGLDARNVLFLVVFVSLSS